MVFSGQIVSMAWPHSFLLSLPEQKLLAKADVPLLSNNIFALIFLNWLFPRLNPLRYRRCAFRFESHALNARQVRPFNIILKAGHVQNTLERFAKLSASGYISSRRPH